MAGKRVGGRYETQQVLGQGGMGAVYRAHDHSTGRALALKRLVLPRDGSRERGRSLFEHEYHVLSQLDHPRVIRVYDYGVDEEGPFYTMELLDGDDLRALSPMSWRRAAELVCDVACSLALLHARRLIHRDVSPRNVRCTEDGRAKLIDFGAMMRFGVAKHVVGTPAFMAPEVMHGQTLDARTDLFSLGAVLYWALTGRRPYPARKLNELRDVWRSPPSPPSAFVEGLPAAMDPLVMGLLSLDPLARPKSAAEVIHRLSAIAELPPEDELKVAQSYLTTPQLVGRDDARISFRRRMVRAMRGSGSSMLVEGDPGMGCSRMLSSFALEGRVAGAVVLRVNARQVKPGEHSVTRALIAALVESAPELAFEHLGQDAALLARVSPELSFQLGLDGEETEPGERLKEEADSDGDHSLSDLQQAAVRYFESLSEGTCLMLAVDNVHRADPASAAVLGELAASADTYRLCVAASIQRGAEPLAPRLVDELERSGGRLRLHPLTQAQTLDLLRSVFGDVPNLAQTGDWVHKLSQGNPQLSMELAQHLVDTSVARFQQGIWMLPASLAELDLPDSLEQALRVRLQRLTGPARSLLEFVCLQGEPGMLLLHRYPQLLQEELSVAHAAVEELTRAEILQLEGNSHRLVQPALASYLRESMPEVRRQEVHLALAQFSAAVHPERLGLRAHHLHRSGDMEAFYEVVLERLRGGLGFDDPDIVFLRSSRGLALNEVALQHAIDTGRHPNEISEWRQALLVLASVVDPGLVRHAEPLLEQLSRESGLCFYDELADVDDPVARIAQCMQRAQAAHDALPEDERGLAPAAAIERLGTTVALLTSIYSRTFDSAGMVSLPPLVEPFAPVAPAMKILHDITVLCEELTVRGGNVFDHRLAVLEAVRVPVPGMGELVRQGTLLITQFYLAFDEAYAGRRSALNRADVLEQHPSYAALAWQVRLVYHLVRGEFARANQCRTQKELLSLTHVENDAHLAMGPIYEGILYTRMGDPLGLKQQLPHFRLQASLYPGWEPWTELFEGLYLLLCDDPGRAETRLSQALRGVEPGQHVAWHHLVWARLECLLAQGRGREAAALADEAQALVGSLALDPVDGDHLTMVMALARGKAGRLDEATAAMQQLLERLADEQAVGLRLSRALEARARLAIWAGDRPAFEHYARLTSEMYRPGRHPSLIVRYERLIAEGREASITVKRDLHVSAETDTSSAESQSTDSLGSSVRTLLGSCRGPDDRATRALDMLLERSGAVGGYLFGSHQGRLELIARRNSGPVTPEVEDLADAHFYEAIGDQRDATATAARIAHQLSGVIEHTAGPESAASPLRPHLLWSQAGGDARITGVVVLREEGAPLLRVPWELMSALSDALLDAGDVSAVAAGH